MKFLKKNLVFPENAYTPIVLPNTLKGMQYIEFGLLRLNLGQQYCFNSNKQEVVLVILSGRCSILVNEETLWRDIGERTTVFGGRAYAAFIPPEKDIKLTGAEDVEIAVCRAQSQKPGVPTLITPDMVKHKSVGLDNWRRDVYDIVDKDISASHLVVGETINPPGNWSSSPPHKHDENNLPFEVKMEEVYFYKLNPQQGFGFQRLYTADGEIDETYTVEQNDVLLIPKGYHPVVAAPGYQLYYLWILAGKQRNLCPNDDPRHSWIKEGK